VEEGAGDVRLHLPVPIVAGHLDKLFVKDAARVVHEDVEGTELIDRKRYRLFGRAVGRDISLQTYQPISLQIFDCRVDVLGDNFSAAGM
jgi:hypothetical protein